MKNSLYDRAVGRIRHGRPMIFTKEDSEFVFCIDEQTLSSDIILMQNIFSGKVPDEWVGVKIELLKKSIEFGDERVRANAVLLFRELASSTSTVPKEQYDIFYKSFKNDSDGRVRGNLKALFDVTQLPENLQSVYDGVRAAIESREES